MKKIIHYFLIFSILIYTNNAMAWWNCAWSNRIEIGITNSGATQSNYVVEIRFTSATLSNYNWANLDKDLRFIDSNDNTQLKFFIMPRSATTQEVLGWVSIPSVPTGTKTIYMYYKNNAATSTSSPIGVLVSGIRMHTKGSTTTPTSYNSWMNAFDSAASGQTGYGCRILTDMTNINNAGQFGNSTNILFSYTTVLTANSTGNWQFRHGPDYGRGGGIYSNDTVLQEKYGTDLWWNNTWSNTSQTLSGNFSANNGSYYVLRSYGGEGGADGPTQLQIANTTATFRVMTTGNYVLNAPPCEAPTITKVINPPKITVPVLTKVVTPYSDPINGTVNPKMIPNARARYLITMTSDGGGGIDSGTIVLTDTIPSNTKMYLGDLGSVGTGPVLFTDGSPSSGLSYSTSNLSYSKDNGVTWNYTPVPDANLTDSLVTNIRINPTGAFSCSNGTTKPKFSIAFDVLIK